MVEFQWWERFLIYLTKQVGVPPHIAIILDGNRRFARKQLNMPIKAGHECGLEKLSYILKVCSHLGIQYLTVYAFSLANFGRSEEEIKDLTGLVKFKMNDKEWIGQNLLNNGIQIRVSGDLDFLEAGLRKSLEEGIELTKDCKRMTLTLCVAYGGRHEIAQGLEKYNMKYNNLAQGSPMSTGDNDLSSWSSESALSLEENHPSTSRTTLGSTYDNTPLEQGTMAEFEKCLYNPDIPYPDLLIRTSGEMRLSDFLIYQCSEKTSFRFMEKLWPEINLIDLLACIFHFRIFGQINNPSSELKDLMSEIGWSIFFKVESELKISNLITLINEFLHI